MHIQNSFNLIKINEKKKYTRTGFLKASSFFILKKRFIDFFQTPMIIFLYEIFSCTYF